jgi:hypothetical protein
MKSKTVWSYSGSDDGDFVIWKNSKYVANVGSTPFVEMPPTQVAFDVDKAHAELIVKALNAHLNRKEILDKLRDILHSLWSKYRDGVPYDTEIKDEFSKLQAAAFRLAEGTPHPLEEKK